MTIERVLLCVDGSPAALEATRLTVELAIGWARPCGPSMSSGAQAWRWPSTRRRPDGSRRPRTVSRAPAAVCWPHVTRLGQASGLMIETALRFGEPFREILREAGTYRPDIVVIGHAGRRGPGPTVIGEVTAQLLEFTEWPVVVVPARQADRTAGPFASGRR